MYWQRIGLHQLFLFFNPTDLFAYFIFTVVDIRYKVNNVVIACGLIQTYVCGRCDEMLKWKPASMNTVDFRLKIVRVEKVG